MQRAQVWKRRALAVAVLLSVGLVAACGSSGASGDGSTRFVAGDGSAVVLPVGDRPPAPDLQAETLTGETVNLRDLTGQVAVLNVWASWCAPCREEAPALNAIAREKADVSSFVGINTRDTKTAAEAFVNRFEVPYPNVWDPDGSVQLKFRQSLPPQAIPSTLFIDPQGRVAARVLGIVDREVLRRIIDELAADGSQPASPPA